MRLDPLPWCDTPSTCVPGSVVITIFSTMSHFGFSILIPMWEKEYSFGATSPDCLEWAHYRHDMRDLPPAADKNGVQ
jgi:hypothetical protein